MSSNKQKKNIAASIRARLLNIAKQHNIDFNRILLLYFQQCFLARLEKSVHKDKFILKGGLLFYGIYILTARPTKDIDFLGKSTANQPEKIKEVVCEITAIELNDGVVFNPHSIRSEIISERASYSGVRLYIEAKLDKAKQNLQIDIGFGDEVVPGPVKFYYPDLLGQRKIKILAYSWSSVIAEKFEAIVSFSDLSSRMKDYYDIYYLQRHLAFNGAELREAIELTFRRRNTDISNSNYIFSDYFINSEDKQKQWIAFLRKNNLDGPDEFSTAVTELINFLDPIVAAVIQNTDFNAKWDYSSQKWIKQ